jgi:LmbE family N-acetylglucosaminyl deacetylase
MIEFRSDRMDSERSLERIKEQQMIVFAIGCHPDDIEFMMGGTLLLLKEKGWTVHYMNIANGSCGTNVHGKEDIIRIRREEGIKAAKILGAVYHESVADDLDVYFTPSLVGRLGATIRQVKPNILLTLSLEDYMEDHMNAARIAVTAAFVRGMRNFATAPSTLPYQKDLTLYHALPYGLRDMMRASVLPEFYVDVTSVMDKKTKALAAHASQKDWLDKSQGLDSYLLAMRDMTKKVGSMSGRFPFAEGWRRHLHLGYSAAEINPLQDLLGALYAPEEKYHVPGFPENDL